mmetsp:Transcript_34172/g.108420  ORF Transcript_34172/g.108420 Transcript_34172/m.108420 type:complete len:205 (-) Transcript_34172:306-920(-)
MRVTTPRCPRSRSSRPVESEQKGCSTVTNCPTSRRGAVAPLRRRRRRRAETRLGVPTLGSAGIQVGWSILTMWRDWLAITPARCHLACGRRQRARHRHRGGSGTKAPRPRPSAPAASATRAPPRHRPLPARPRAKPPASKSPSRVWWGALRGQAVRQLRGRAGADGAAAEHDLRGLEAQVLDAISPGGLGNQIDPGHRGLEILQ